MKEKHQLMKHQRYALACMNAGRNIGLFYEAGTGKTVIALMWMRNALRAGRIKDALVICPASLVGNWNSSIDRMIEFEDVTDADVEMLKKAVTVVSFRRTWKSERTTRRCRDGSVYESTVYRLSPAVDKQWGAIVIDESHALGGHSSAQTAACMQLAACARYRFVMSGTPVSGSAKASGKDWQKLYGQVRFLDPRRWRNWSEFCKECVASTDRWHKPASYFESVCEETLRDYGIFAKLEDCVDMPGYTETTIPCELTEKKVYKDMKDLCMMQYNIDPKTGGAAFVKMLQVCSGHLRDDDSKVLRLKTSKDDALEDLLNGTADKVVVFCNFSPSVDRCAEISRKTGRKTVVFDGRSKGETWREFQYGDADTIVVQYQAGGAGLDLFEGHTMVMYEPCMSALNMTQAKARIYRKGQTCRCRYVYLVTPRTVEAKVLDSVLRGVSVTTTMLAEFSLGV